MSEHAGENIEEIIEEVEEEHLPDARDHLGDAVRRCFEAG